MLGGWFLAFLALCTCTGSPDSIGLVVRNLSGQKIDLFWLAPGREPRKRVSQTKKPVLNGSTTSVNSFQSHEFVVTVYPNPLETMEKHSKKKPEKDGHDSCEFWASVGECAKNPSYMLKVCDSSCRAVAAAEAGEDDTPKILAQFTVGAVDEFIDVMEDWSLVRNSETKRAKDMVDSLWAECEGEETCATASAFESCLRPRLDSMVAKKVGLLQLERSLLERVVERIPKAPLPKDAETPVENEDLEEKKREYEGAMKMAATGRLGDSCGPLHSEFCQGGNDDVAKACVGAEAGKLAEVMNKATGSQRKPVRARNEANRNMTCEAEPGTSPAVKERDWTWDPMEPTIWASSKGAPSIDADVAKEPVRRIFDLFAPESMPEARITLIDNFASASECEAMVKQARPRLRRATHAHEGDLTHVSNTRDSQQSTVRPYKSNQLNLTDPIARVKARSVALANELSDYKLGVAGQEELMAIQYNQGQQYMLHCDGSCDGAPFMNRGRLATVLIYCAVADKGGGTSFPNADVYVAPKAGQAVYFHFRGPESASRTELWHTEHSGCPVKEGEKWVVTQWLRDGVDNEHPASLYAPFGTPV